MRSASRHLLAQRLPRPRRHAVLRSLAGDARIRALLDRLRQCLCAAAGRRRYLGNLRRDLAAAGIGCPLFLMLSGGGLTTVETAARFPVRLVESGPAGGAIFASHIARAMRPRARSLSFDMGGTTAKICLIDDCQPQTSRAFEVARIYRVQEGQRAAAAHPGDRDGGDRRGRRLDRARRWAQAHHGRSRQRRRRAGPRLLRPRRHGADRHRCRPGARPHRPAAFSGGRIALDVEAAARRRWTARSATRSTLGTAMAALAVVSEIVDENMANAARVHAIESGKDAAGRTLIAFGGARAVACRRAWPRSSASTGYWCRPAPESARRSVSCARRSPTRSSAAGLLRLSAFDAVEANALFDDMRAEAEAIVRAARPMRALTQARHAFMRYRGQGHEIAVPLPARSYAHGDGEALARRSRRPIARSTAASSPASRSRW